MKIMSQRRWSFNILYWLIVPILLIACYFILDSQTQRSSTAFLGYTDTQEHLIKIDISAYVDKIHVTQGQKVKQGDLLVELSKAEMDKDIRVIDQEIGTIREKNAISIFEYKTQIEKIKTETAQKTTALREEIKVEESKLAYAKSMLNPTASSASNVASHPSKTQISALQNEIQSLQTNSQKLKSSYQKLIDTQSSKIAEVNKLIDQKTYIINEKNKLKILAPFDGVIGNINIRDKEYVERQREMITFYEPSPTRVVGYIHESQSAAIKVGDSLSVISSLHPGQLIKGVVIGKGFRIVEIPERLRKVPEFKTYGMEIYIKLSASNALYQKELVQITTLI